ncbi:MULTISPECIES: hypothetical protein [unclassified Halomonas]|uniref:hypothetical protein n=1 Tax=unclassified Halomonas TaxID=2609666 RepID=UPI001CF40E5F|nr:MULTISPECIES: hypothetical protein [unclassified Halomonas]MCA8864526.1 hypothetical protein [Halomonas sp. SBBP1]UZH08292.1 hypothetical protein OM794_12895 [Halomonas sp. BDJS001]
MTPYDFGLGVLASWLANRLEVASIKTESTSVEDLSLNIEAIADLKLERKKLFHSFDVFTQLHEVSEGLASPVAHLLIEAEPSTHYHLVSLVLESSLTGEWYYFRRGRMAFQGTGGGHQQAERVVSIFKREDIPISVWVLERELMDDFESGYMLWPQVRAKAIPFLAANLDSEKWSWIKAQASEILRDSSIF